VVRRELIDYLDTRPDLKIMMREQPEWYRHLSRNPLAIYELEKNSQIFFERTFGQKVDKFNQQLRSASTILDLISALGKEIKS
jgi:hypothetical protein